jgi:signal transduction histidine kinase
MKIKTLLCAAILLPAMVVLTPSWAADGGTAEEAKAMLEKAVAEVKGDEKQALEKFNAPEGDYKQADLYVFCADAKSGEMNAHPTLIGKNVNTIVDVNGKKLGEEMITTAKEGTISEIDYMWPRPGTTEPVEKHTYYTIAGTQLCGVGFYP